MEEPRKPALDGAARAPRALPPESQHQFAIRSLEEIPDWNISRQLWWGHQQPLWYCPDGHVTCAWPPPDACAECGSTELERDPDVLDTWFSSALWPYATLGWPERTPELERYYPGDVRLDRARDHPPLGEPDDLGRARADRRDPVHGRDHPLDDARLRRPADVEEPRHRHRPARPDRKARRRRDAVRAPEDVLDAGRPLHRRPRSRKGGSSRTSSGTSRGCCSRTRARRDARRRARSRSAGSWRGSTRRGPSSSRRWAAFDFSHSVQALYRLTFDDFCDWYAEAIKPRLARATRTRGDRARRARAPARSCCTR